MEMTEVVLNMPKGERNSIIEMHKFYVETKKSVRSQFFSDAEIERKAAKRTNELPIDDYGDSFYEKQLELLWNMRDMERLNAIADMFFFFEKELKDWFYGSGIFHWGEPKDKIKASIDHASPKMIMECLKSFGWDVFDKPFYDKIDELRLLVNIHKHGPGKSCQSLFSQNPDYFHTIKRFTIEGCPIFISHDFLCVTDEHMEDFSNAIIEFWESVPSRISNSDNLELPSWLKINNLSDSSECLEQ